MNRESIVIVGPGRTGTALGVIFRRAGHDVTALIGGSADSAARARGLLGAEVPVRPHSEALRSGTLVLIAVPDDHLDEAVAQLAAGSTARPDVVAVHVAGARGRDALAPLEPCGARVAAFHPLRAFPTPKPDDRGLAGALCAVECEAGDRDRLYSLARDAGGTPVVLDRADRALYHAAATIAGNATLALIDVAARAIGRAGVPLEVGLPALVDLAKNALDHAVSVGPAKALTGPVVRGDKDVVARHVAALEAYAPVDSRFYVELVRALIRLSSQREDGWKARTVGGVLGEAGA